MKLILIAIIGFFFIISCGKSKKGTSNQKEEIQTVQKVVVSGVEKTASISSDTIVDIEIRSNDRMKFNIKKIVVKAGQKVKLTLVHTGRMNKRIMGHNVVILKKGTNLSVFASKAAASRENDFIPIGATEIIAHTKMIGGGETTTIEFTAPELGVYDYICSFPAHYAMMKGKFVVE
jgi:azurin